MLALSAPIACPETLDVYVKLGLAVRLALSAVTDTPVTCEV